MRMRHPRPFRAPFAAILLALTALGVAAFVGCGSSSSDEDAGRGDGGSRPLADASATGDGGAGGGDDDAMTAGDGSASDDGATTGFTDASYTWTNVAIGGGGWITGLVRDPGSGDLYARGDVGALYRYDTTSARWIPLLDTITFPNTNEYGVESVALAPDYQSTGTLYYAAGKYVYGAHDIFKSKDRGVTWTAASFQQVLMHGNDDDRWCGERLAVDPNNAARLYFASPDGTLPDGGTSTNGGLWQSTNGSEVNADGGTSWSQTAFPVQGNSAEGLSFVVFDPSATVSSPTRSKTVYVGVVDASGAHSGIWRSTDGGGTWSRLPGTSKASPCRAVLSSEGDLYVTFRYVSASSPGGLAKLAHGSDTLVDIDPPVSGSNAGAGYYAVAVDPTNADRVYTTQSEGKIPASGSPVVRSVFSETTTGGSSWSPLGYTTGTVAITQQPYTWFAGPAALVINSQDAAEAWVSDGFGIMHTTNLTAATPTWSSFVTGIEEIVPDALLAPKSSPVLLLSGASDVGGFIHESLTTPPTSRLPTQGDVVGGVEAISYSSCPSDPSVIVFTGHYYKNSDDSYAPYLGYSKDGGQNFTSIDTSAGGTSFLDGGGRIVVSAKSGECGTWILQQFDGDIWRITDGTTSSPTWTKSSATGSVLVSTLSGDPTDASVNRLHNDTLYMQQLAVDEVTGTYYIASVASPSVTQTEVQSPGSATLYQSTDGLAWSVAAKVTFPTLSLAATKTLANQNPAVHYTLRAVPGRSSDLWLAVRDVGVFRTTAGGDGGSLALSQVGTLTTSGLLAFGVPPSGSTTPSLFLHTAEGSYQRSDDLGQTFTSIDDPRKLETVGNDPSVLTADPNVWGRVFVGTNGRGIFVGAP
jgi:hypothetical protein